MEQNQPGAAETKPPADESAIASEEAQTTEPGIKPSVEERLAPQRSTIRQDTTAQKYANLIIDYVDKPEFTKLLGLTYNTSVVSENGQLVIKEGYVPDAKFYFGQDEFGEDVAIFQEKDREEAIQFTFEHQQELGIKDSSKVKLYSVADELWKEFQKALSKRMSQPPPQVKEVKEEAKPKKSSDGTRHERLKDSDEIKPKKNEQRQDTEQPPESDRARQERNGQKEANEKIGRLDAQKKKHEVELQKEEKKVEGQEEMQTEAKEDREKEEQDKEDIDKQQPPDLRTKP